MFEKIIKKIQSLDRPIQIGIGAGLIIIILIFAIAPTRYFVKYYLWDSVHFKPKYFFKQGVKYEENTYYNYAIGSFKRALRLKGVEFNIDPRNLYQLESLFNLGVVYYQQKKDYVRSMFYFNKYIDLLDRIGAKNPHEKEIYRVINYMLAQDDSSKNQQARNLKNQGNEAYFKKEFELALEHYKKALTADPSYTEVYNNIATTYFQMGDFKNAVDYWKLTLLFTPDELDIYINIALAYETQLKDHEQAIKYYNKLKSRLKPNDPRYIEAETRIANIKKKK